MPIREFRCPACKRKVEIRCKMDDDPAPPCCSCGEWMERIISQTQTPNVKDGTPTFHDRDSK
jgi:putative FmdB family regulatory protein